MGKHVALMTEIASAVDARHLYDISALEQTVSCSEDPNDQFKAITTTMKDHAGRCMGKGAGGWVASTLAGSESPAVSGLQCVRSPPV